MTESCCDSNASFTPIGPNTLSKSSSKLLQVPSPAPHARPHGAAYLMTSSCHTAHDDLPPPIEVYVEDLQNSSDQELLWFIGSPFSHSAFPRASIECSLDVSNLQSSMTSSVATRKCHLKDGMENDQRRSYGVSCTTIIAIRFFYGGNFRL